MAMTSNAYYDLPVDDIKDAKIKLGAHDVIKEVLSLEPHLHPSTPPP